jgi:ferredoxin-NADP reductase
VESGPFVCFAHLAVIECPLGFFSIGQLLKNFTWLIASGFGRTWVMSVTARFWRMKSKMNHLVFLKKRLHYVSVHGIF